MTPHQRRDRVLVVLAALRREFPGPGGHTATLCVTCRDWPSLGAGECYRCIAAELAELVTPQAAGRYVKALEELSRARNDIDVALDAMEAAA